jgi:gluconokinase
LVKLVVMGVAGAGKSTLARALARALDCPLIEGDEQHLAASKAKMRAGIALDDADREPWLDLLGALLAGGESGVLTCSALKRRYRDRLSARVPMLKFVFIEIEPAEAEERVAARSSHFFAPSLVASQFAALESPRGEPGVLAVPARQPIGEQVAAVTAWLARGAP